MHKCGFGRNTQGKKFSLRKTTINKFSNGGKIMKLKKSSSTRSSRRCSNKSRCMQQFFWRICNYRSRSRNKGGRNNRSCSKRRRSKRNQGWIYKQLQRKQLPSDRRKYEDTWKIAGFSWYLWSDRYDTPVGRKDSTLANTTGSKISYRYELCWRWFLLERRYALRAFR